MKSKLLTGLLFIGYLSANAQVCFDAGNGSNGAYSATSNTTLAGGTYNYTTFNINSGVAVTVTGSQPLIIKCTGAVTLNGTLIAIGGSGADAVTFSNGGAGGIGVAGGANGGGGTYSSSLGPLAGNPGSGPGGTNNQGDAWSGGGGAGYSAAGYNSGNPGGGMGGPAYGTTTIVGLQAGSGGGGGSGGYSCGGGGGGGGGGLIYITSAVSINVAVTGGVYVNGGNGGSDGTGNCGGGGGGSGGSIIMMSPSMTINGQVQANGGIGGASNVSGSPYYGTGANGAPGRIRLDYNGSLIGSPMFSPAVGYTGVLGNGLSTAAVQTSGVSCFGASDGSALATINNGTGPYTGVWSPMGGTSTVATGLPAGTYTFTATDASGCTASTTVTITQPPALALAISQTNVTCFGTPNGSATATPTGGTPAYSYSWAPTGGNAATATGLSQGCYTCTVTDANGCSTSQTTCITEPTQMQVAVTSMNATCFGSCDGMLSASVFGGTPGYSYSWAPGGQTTSTITNLCAGCYTLTVVDMNGCMTNTVVCVTEPPQPPGGFLGNDTLICLNDTFTLCAPSGFASYMWSTGSTAMCITADTTTCYMVTAVDMNGCMSMDTVCVNESPCLTIAEMMNADNMLFPNPANDVIRIHHGEAAPQKVEVFNSQGKLCLTKNVADNGELNVSELAEGVYVVIVSGTKYQMVIAR